ncbi:tape measure protein, partial [Morganella morganii]
PTIEREFANTTQTMSQSLQIASNNITKFFGENTTVKTFTRIFNDSVVTISENLDYLTNILVIAAGVIGSRYAGALALAGAAQVKKARDTMAGAAASRQAAVAERDAAAVLVRKTVADRDAAMSALNLAMAEYQVARGSAAEATALANVTRLKTAYSNAAIIAAQANNTLSASQARVAATGLTMANALKAMNWLLAPIGGPAGAAMLAGAAVYYFFQKTEEARQEASKFADELEGLTEKMQSMNRVQLEGMIAKATQHMSTQKDEIKELGSEIDSLNERYKKAGERNYSLAGAESDRAKILNEIKIKQAELDTKTTEYSRTLNSTGLMQAKLNGELLQGADLLTAEARTVLPNAGAALRAYGLDLDEATKAKQKFNSASLKVEWSDAGADMKKTLEREIEMAGAKDDVVRRQLQVKYYVEDKGISEQEAEKLAELAAKAGEASEAKKTGIKTSREAAAEAKKEATEAEKLKQKITDLANATKVAELETKGLSREAAILEAVQKLGSKANAAQIAEITELAGKEYDLTQKIKDRKDAFEQNPRVKADQDMKLAQEQLERQLKGDLITEEQYQKRSIELKAEHARKTAEINAKSTVSPVQEMAAQVDPVQALANEHAQKLALIKDFENQKVITAQQSLELMNAANTEYEDARLNAQWEIWRNQSQANQFLADGLDALGQRSSNVLTGLVTGTQNLNDAFRNVASTIIDEAVGALVQMGMQQIKNMVTENAMRKASSAQAIADATVTGSAINSAMAPAAATTSIATMGSAATWGMMAMSSAIPAMIAIAGARYNGGPVDANKMYRVGENGQPEIFKASNGHQYMIPGDSGKVISNRQMGGGGGISMGDMHFNFQVQAPNGITQKEVTMITGMVKGTVYDILMTEIRSGAIQGNQRY